jgi:hypothetical protein
MQVLKFSTNWNNKLNCDCFTTLRLSSRLSVGELIEVEDRGVTKGLYTVLDKRRLNDISVINDWMAMLDTGYSANETRDIIKKMYPKIENWENQPIYYYLLRKKKK